MMSLHFVLNSIHDVRRWRQKGPPKCWYPTASLHSVTTWRWNQKGPPKRSYPTASLHSITTW